jgi:hypothetical protein
MLSRSFNVSVLPHFYPIHFASFNKGKPQVSEQEIQIKMKEYSYSKSTWVWLKQRCFLMDLWIVSGGVAGTRATKRA